MYYFDQPSQNRITKYESDVLRVCKDAISSQRDYLIRLHGEWLTQILFAHGVQNCNYDTVSGQITFSGQGGDFPWWPGYNVLDSVVNRMKSALMQASPRRDVKSVQNSEIALAEARIGKLVVDWAYETLKIEEKELEAADWFIKTGNVVVSFYFDKTQGEVLMQDPQTGEDIKSGRVVPRVDSPSRWYFDSRASTFDEARNAIRVTLQPIEWVDERYPGMADMIPFGDFMLTGDDVLERRLLNLTQATSVSGNVIDREHRVVTIFEWYELPCPKYPQGRHAILAGNGSTPSVVLQEWDFNPYGMIPCVLITLSKFSGRLFGESPLKFLLPPQREINRRRRQIMKNCDLLGNMQIAIPVRGGTPPASMTNKVAGQYYYDPDVGPPTPIAVPPMPPFVLESERASLDMVGYMAPVSPSDMQAAEKATSGIQLQLIEEIKRRSLMPLMRNWEIGWDAFWKKYLQLWRKFTIFPQQIKAIGPEAAVAAQYVTGDMVSENVTVKVVPYSSLPTSRTAAFAEWTETMKVLAAAGVPLDQTLLRRFWEDIGKGDMARTYRDMTADRELAERNLLRVMVGQPIYPRVQDNPEVHLDVFMNFMKSAEYEEMLAQDPEIEVRLMETIKMFGFAISERELAMVKESARIGMQAAMAVPMPPGAEGSIGPNGRPVMPEEGSKGGGGKSNIGPGTMLGGVNPSATQGWSKPANPYVDVGGRPAG